MVQNYLACSHRVMVINTSWLWSLEFQFRHETYFMQDFCMFASHKWIPFENSFTYNQIGNGGYYLMELPVNNLRYYFET